jgi:hypothetical protein
VASSPSSEPIRSGRAPPLSVCARTTVTPSSGRSAVGRLMLTSSIPRSWRLPASVFRPPRQWPASAFLPPASEIHRQRRQLPPGRQPPLRTRRRADRSSILHDSYRMSPRPGSEVARKPGTAREFSVRASGATLSTASGRWRCVIACSRASRDSFGDPGAADGMSWDGRVAARDDGDRGRGGRRA